MSDEYPECEKMALVRDESQTIGGFLEWASEQGWEFVDNNNIGHYRMPMPVNKPIEQILAQYFEIDLELVEKEKQQILDNFNEQAA